MAANPFNFLNPVKRRELLGGRQAELDEIEYYLQGAVEGQPTHLALLGEPGFGKTSLMNVLADAAADRGLLAVPVTLTESVVESELEFWRAVSESLMARGTEAGLYEEGKGDEAKAERVKGEVFRTFREIMATLAVPQDTKFVEWDFAAFYAGARRAGDATRPVPMPTIQRDLAKFSDEAKQCGRSGIVLLFDEADLLPANPSILQGLTGALSGLDRYLIAVAGRPDLLDRLGQAYSPMRRRFKHLAVGPLASPWLTRQCIETRLKAENLDPEDWLDTEAVEDVHSTTGGCPWEIQLVCHFMFREAQAAGRRRLTLTPEVVRRVVEELQSRLRPSGTNVAALRQLGETQIVALWDLTELGSAPLSDLARLGLARAPEAPNDARVAEEEGNLSALVERFRSERLLTIDEGTGARRLAGDQYDRAYLKYSARAGGVKLHHVHAGYRELAQEWLRTELARVLAAGPFEEPFALDTEPYGLTELVPPTPSPVPSAREHRRILDAFQGWLEVLGKTPAIVTTLRVRLGYDAAPTPITFVRAASPDGVEEARRRVQAALNDLEPRMRALGLQTVALEVREEVVPPLDYFGQQLAEPGAEDVRDIAMAMVAVRTVEAYSSGDTQRALWCAEAASMLFPGEFVTHNNLGYLLMNVRRDFNRAEECFVRAAELSRKPIVLHNLATVNAAAGRREPARTLYEEVIGHEDSEQDDAACLNVLGRTEEALELREARNVVVAACSHACLAVLLDLEGAPESARTHASTARALAPHDAAIRAALAHLGDTFEGDSPALPDTA